MHFYEDYEKTQPKPVEVENKQAQPLNAITSQDLEDLKKAFAEQVKAEVEKNKQEMLEFFRQNNIENNTDNDDKDKEQDVDNKEEEKKEE